jgi:hypothetical protein
MGCSIERRNQWSLTLISVNWEASARLSNSLTGVSLDGGVRQGDEYYIHTKSKTQKRETL